MSISDTTIKAAKPNPDKPYKLADEKGLHVLINSNGSKYFRLKYRFGGKEKTLALGVYPETTLKQAREKRDAARKLIADGIDPNENKKAIKASRAESAANSFEVVAREWFGKHMAGKSESYQNRNNTILNTDLVPYLGQKPISEIKAFDLVQVLNRLEGANAKDKAQRALQVCGQVFRFAVASGRAERDFTPDLRGSLRKMDKGHFAAITDPLKVGGLLRAFDVYEGTLVVKSALRLAPLVFVRPVELRSAEWAHIDLEAKEWSYQVTKTDTQHIVPLSTQAVAILQAIHPLTGSGRYVFPSARTPNGSRQMSDVALLAALRRMGFDKSEMCVHGFRAMARTILDEKLKVRVDLIEHQLAHKVRDTNGRAYNRTAHLDDRHKMMQAWADYLDELKKGAAVFPFKRVG